MTKIFCKFLFFFISVEETQEPIKIQDVKTETEIEVLKQSENLEPSSETKIEAGNELKGTPDLLEQAVSQIKIHPVEIKPTMEETEMLESGTDSELKNILPVGLQCKLCQAKFMSNKGNSRTTLTTFAVPFCSLQITFLLLSFHIDFLTAIIISVFGMSFLGFNLLFP